MKKIILVTFCVILICVGCKKEDNSTSKLQEPLLLEKSSYEDNIQSDNELYMSSDKKEYFKGDDISISIYNYTNQDLSYDAKYSFEYKYNNTWYKVPYSNSDTEHVWEDILILLPSSSYKPFLITSEGNYTPLVNGEYRVVKEVGEKVLSVKFYIVDK